MFKPFVNTFFDLFWMSFQTSKRYFVSEDKETVVQLDAKSFLYLRKKIQILLNMLG
jgi:hypothetical protein